MSAPIVHFEIGSPNAAELANFYHAVLGWKFAPLGAAQAIIAGAEGGPTGMLNALGHPPETYVIVYAAVADLEEALARTADAGGQKIVGPVALPDGRRFAWVKDTAGNVLGLITGEADK